MLCSCLRHDNEVISDEEFAILYDENYSKEVFPHWKYNKFDFVEWDTTECRAELKFELIFFNDLDLVQQNCDNFSTKFWATFTTFIITALSCGINRF